MDWFVSDLHLFHANILKYCNRKWLSAEEKEKLNNNDEEFYVSKESVKAMDDEIIDNINKYVKPNDVLWHLGDFCFGPSRDYFNIAKNYRQRIMCKNMINIRGNHDKKELDSLFSRSYDQHMIRHESGQKIVVNHYAMAVWDGSHRGSWNLFGHSHSTLNDWIDQHMPDAKMLDVGVDNVFKLFGEYRPLSFYEIKEFMDKKPGHRLDHH